MRLCLHPRLYGRQQQVCCLASLLQISVHQCWTFSNVIRCSSGSVGPSPSLLGCPSASLCSCLLWMRSALTNLHPCLNI